MVGWEERRSRIYGAQSHCSLSRGPSPMLGSWDAVTGALQNEWGFTMIPCYYYYHHQHQ